MTITPPPSDPTVNPTPVPRPRVDPSPSPRRKAAAVHSIRRASRKGRLWVAAVGLLALTSGAAACGATSRAAPAVTGSPRPELSVGPAGAAFYQPPATLPPGPHGTLIWERPFHGRAALSGATNTLLLYTQVGIGGHLAATSGYVAIPHGTPPRVAGRSSPGVTALPASPISAPPPSLLTCETPPPTIPCSRSGSPMDTPWFAPTTKVSARPAHTPTSSVPPKDEPCSTSSTPPVSSLPR